MVLWVCGGANACVGACIHVVRACGGPRLAQNHLQPCHAVQGSWHVRTSTHAPHACTHMRAHTRSLSLSLSHTHTHTHLYTCTSHACTLCRSWYCPEMPEWNMEKYRFYVDLPGDFWESGVMMRYLRSKEVKVGGHNVQCGRVAQQSNKVGGLGSRGWLSSQTKMGTLPTCLLLPALPAGQVGHGLALPQHRRRPWLCYALPHRPSRNPAPLPTHRSSGTRPRGSSCCPTRPSPRCSKCAPSCSC